MSFGSMRGQASTEQGWRPPTTMVDVLFLTLAFFITLSTFSSQAEEREREIDVSLPESRAENPETSGRVPTITVRTDGSVYMAGTAYTDEALRAKLEALQREFGTSERPLAVLIRGDAGAAYGRVVEVIQIARAAGLTNAKLAAVRRAEGGP
jgi:biopolymer transport protein ExbD